MCDPFPTPRTVHLFLYTAITERSIFVLVCILRLCVPYVHWESASWRFFFCVSVSLATCGRDDDSGWQVMRNLDLLANCVI